MLRVPPGPPCAYAPFFNGASKAGVAFSTSATKNIPVILLTALAQENVVLQGIKLGAKDYIRKPFNPTELVSRLSKHVAA